jgi:hypothetical protein
MTRYNGTAISEKSIEGMRCVQAKKGALQWADTLPAVCTSGPPVYLLPVKQAKIAGKKGTYHFRIQKSNGQLVNYFTANTASSSRASRLPDVV